MAGPAAKPEGLELFRHKAKELPRSAGVIIYCGCCPFAQCPNIRPAYRTLHKMGFPRVRVVDIPTNFHTDWLQRAIRLKKLPASNLASVPDASGAVTRLRQRVSSKRHYASGGMHRNKYPWSFGSVALE